MRSLGTRFKRLHRRHWLVISATLVGLGLGLSLINSLGWSLYLRSLPLDPRPLASTAAAPVDEILTEANLVDSIMSIVQNYYVDEVRVKNYEMLDAALHKLAERADFRLREDDGQYTLISNETELAIERNPALDYQGLVVEAERIATFLDELATKRGANNRGAEGKETGSFRFLNAMLAALDPHSSLLNASDYRDLRQGTEGTFGGLGVVVGIRDNVLTVIKPLPLSPADRAGIRKHDRIMSIDEINTYGSSLDQLVEYMRGSPGTSVHLSLLREGDISPTAMNLTREVIQVSSVDSKLIEQGSLKLLHMTVESFSSRTAHEMRTAIEQAEAATAKRLGGIVIDLRTNPGGLLDQAVEMADLFLVTGKIVTTRGRRQEVERATRDNKEFDYPIVVLINSESASASEIVAGALQDQNRALVIGQPSFGKGSVQTIFELPKDTALKLTIARYYTPSGRSIQNVGITPHIWLQPVYRNEKNSNLLGTYRYKNENFLMNRLEGQATVLSTSHQTPDIKAYYLADVSPDEPSGDKDVELDLARVILAKVAAAHGTPALAGTRRASNWLAIAAPEISARLDNYQTQTNGWLKKKHAIEWGQADTPEVPVDVSVGFGTGLGDTLTVDDLPEMSIPWRVVNNGKKDADRVTVFVTSTSSGIEAAEFVVGRVPAGAVREGVISTTIIPELIYPAAQLRLGLAADAIPIKVNNDKLTVKINRTQKADLTPTLVLTNEQGGRNRGKLEPNESADLEITVANNTTTDARNVKAVLRNLSGKQIEVIDTKMDVGLIRAGDTKVLKFRIRGTQTLISEKLSVGMSLMCEGLVMPRFHNFTVASDPNMTRDRYTKLFGH